MGDPFDWCVYPNVVGPFFFFLMSSFAVKDRPELEAKFAERVQAAIKYARTIEDFGELIDPRTLARHCLGPEPSLYVLSTLDREERKRKLHFTPFLRVYLHSFYSSLHLLYSSLISFV